MVAAGTPKTSSGSVRRSRWQSGGRRARARQVRGRPCVRVRPRRAVRRDWIEVSSCTGSDDGETHACWASWCSINKPDSSACVTTDNRGYARRTSRFQYGFCATSDARGRLISIRLHWSNQHPGTFRRRRGVFLGSRGGWWEAVDALQRETTRDTGAHDDRIPWRSASAVST